MTNSDTILVFVASVLGGGIISAFIGWMYTSHIANRERRISFLDDQIRRLYGPIHIHILQIEKLDELLQKFHKAYQEERKKVKSDKKKLEEFFKSTISIVMEYSKEIENNNERIRKLTEENSAFLDPDDYEIILNFQEKCIRWRKETERDVIGFVKMKTPSTIYKHLNKLFLLDKNFNDRMKGKFHEKNGRLHKMLRGSSSRNQKGAASGNQEEGAFNMMNWLNKNSGGMIAILTAILIIATAIYVSITYNMLRESRKQFEYSYRPYVGIGKYDYKNAQNEVSFTFNISNSGRSPATDVMVSYDWIPEYEEWKVHYTDKEGESKVIKRKEIKHLFFSKPTTIFPSQTLTLAFKLEYNRTLEYWTEKYNELSIEVVIFYRGIENREFKDFYKSRVRLVYKPNKKIWDIDWSEAQ